MADPRFVLLIILIFYFTNFPGPQQQPYGSLTRDEDVLGAEHVSLNILNSSCYGDFEPKSNRWLNLTGLREKDRFNWFLLEEVRTAVDNQISRFLKRPASQVFGHSLSQDNDYGLYRNITSTLGGKWVRLGTERSLPVSHINLTEIAPNIRYSFMDFERNLTGHEGNIRFYLTTSEEMLSINNDSIREARAIMRISDDTSLGDWWEVNLFGVYLTNSGMAVFTTTSEKFSGVFALPHFMPSSYSFALSRSLLNLTVSKVISDQELGKVSVANPWTSLPEGNTDSIYGTPKCEFVVFLQQHPVSRKYQDKLQLLPGPEWIERVEREARSPTGFLLPLKPHIAFSMVALSPDCGFAIESKGPPRYGPGDHDHLKGLKIEFYNENVRRAVLALSILLTMQIFLFKRQMKESSTPSTRNRISFLSVAVLSFGDGLVFFALLIASLISKTASLALMAASFLALASVFFFGLRFLMDIWTVQASERERQQRQNAADANDGNMVRPGNDLSRDVSILRGTLPLPVLSNQPVNNDVASPIMILSDQTENNINGDTFLTAPDAATRRRRELGMLYSRFCFLLLLCTIFLIHASTWPTALRAALSNVFAFTYFSFWWPQIIRNTRRNCRKALRWDFVLGQTVFRLIPFLYFYVVPSNIFFTENDPQTFLLLCAWSWIQIMALLSQDFVGSRFLVPNSWVPPAYDYHPIIKEDEEGILSEARTSMDDGSSPSKSVESRRSGKRMFDCTICTQDMEVPIVPIGEGSESTASSGTLFARRLYMVTPCRHIFHTTCLESWMRYRLQCPNCRETLPPL